jgi:hypothetical protein
MSKPQKYIDAKKQKNSGTEEKLSEIELLAAAYRTTVSSGSIPKAFEELRKLNRIRNSKIITKY